MLLSSAICGDRSPLPVRGQGPDDLEGRGHVPRDVGRARPLQGNLLLRPRIRCPQAPQVRLKQSFR